MKDEKSKHPLLKDKAVRKPKPHRKLIFLMGFQNTGKDTVAELIKDISPDPVVIVALADILKSECYPALGREFVKGEDGDGEGREWKDAHRADIIAYGEGRKHENGMFYWIKQALDKLLVKKYDRRVDYPHIIVTDCRRTEEVMWLKHFKLGHYEELLPALEIYEPLLFAVHKEGAEKDKDYLTHIAIEYAAETRAFHRMIKNYGNLKELKQQLSDLYATYIK